MSERQFRSNRPANVALRQQIMAAVEADPRVSVTALARRHGCSVSRVAQLLRELGYRREWRRVGEGRK